MVALHSECSSFNGCARKQRVEVALRTGVPLVDALMRELAATGFMANRGRGFTEGC